MQPFTSSRVAVRVVPEHEGHLDLVAVDRPSSGSVTVTENGMFSPKANVPPSTGVVSVTVGDVLPTVIVVFAEPVFPLESVTVASRRRRPGRVRERRVRIDRVDRAVAVEVPLVADRVARVGIAGTPRWRS